MQLPKNWLDKFKDIDEPSGCPACGAIAGCCNDYPNCPGGKPMFHLQDNVYFERQPDGRIRIVVREGEQADAPIIKDTTTTVDGFASVMATMSARGEDLQSWQEAGEYLRRSK